MTRDEIREASSTMFSAYIDELCDNRWKAYRTERNWFELVAVDFENHKNIHIIDWVILKNRPQLDIRTDLIYDCPIRVNTEESPACTYKWKEYRKDSTRLYEVYQKVIND